MTLRWISLVPPAIDRLRLPRKPPTHDAAVAVRRHRRRAEQARGPTSCTSWSCSTPSSLRTLDSGPGAAAAEGPRAWCARPWRPAPGCRPRGRRGCRAPGDRCRPAERPGADEGRPAPRRPGPSTSPAPSTPARWRAWCGPRAHPPVGAPTRQSSGTNTSVRNTSLNMLGAGQLAQRTHVDALGAACRRRSSRCPRGGARRGRCGPGRCPRSALAAIDVHTFCPVSSQPPSTRTALVVSEARSRPGAGLAEHLAPRELAPQRRRHPPLLLGVGAVDDDRRQRPRPDREVGAPDAGAARTPRR